MWQKAPAPDPYKWENAGDYCQQLVLDGHNDWRVPSRIELVSLVDFTRDTPAIDTAFCAASGLFWTAWQSDATGQSTYWWVKLFYGAADALSIERDREEAVRCVRAHTCRSALEPRYSVDEGAAAASIVTDNGTGLIWPREATGETLYNFSEAAVYCAELELDGGGWRVPSMKELQTIVDERLPQETGPTDDAVFLGIASLDSLFWMPLLSSRGETATAAWSVTFEGCASDSRIYGTQLEDRNSVRCVR